MSDENYSEWSKRMVTVDILRLDKENPRLPVDIRNQRQDKIREFLVLNEQVDKIAKSIVSEGFIPFEPIYVIKEKKYFTVLEGNRRTCALQLLRDPSKSPVMKNRLFKKLSKEINLVEIEKIPVIIAPSRQVLRKILYLKHADEAQKKWSRQQKNRFIADAILCGKNIDEIAHELNEPVSEISDAVKEILLQEIFLQLNLPPEIEEKSIQPSFPLSTVTRIISSQEFREYTGIRIKDSSLVADMGNESFRIILRKIVTDLVNKAITSRTLDKVSDITGYINELKSFLKQNNCVDTEEPFSFTPVSSAPRRAEEPSSPRERKKQEKLIPNTKKYLTGISKLDLLIQQGQSIPAGSYLFASALLLRTILELGVVRIFELNDEQNRVLNDNGRTKGLSTIMKELLKHDSWFDDQSYLEDLKRFCDPNSSQYKHIETLNRYIHGKYSMPDKETLNSIWLIVEPLIMKCCKNTPS